MVKIIIILKWSGQWTCLFYKKITTDEKQIRRGGFEIWDLGFKIYDLRFEIWDLRFGI
jgi:hypothetical protein